MTTNSVVRNGLLLEGVGAVLPRPLETALVYVPSDLADHIIPGFLQTFRGPDELPVEGDHATAVGHGPDHGPPTSLTGREGGDETGRDLRASDMLRDPVERSHGGRLPEGGRVQLGPALDEHRVRRGAERSDLNRYAGEPLRLGTTAHGDRLDDDLLSARAHGAEGPAEPGLLGGCALGEALADAGVKVLDAYKGTDDRGPVAVPLRIRDDRDRPDALVGPLGPAGGDHRGRCGLGGVSDHTDGLDPGTSGTNHEQPAFLAGLDDQPGLYPIEAPAIDVVDAVRHNGGLINVDVLHLLSLGKLKHI